MCKKNIKYILHITNFKKKLSAEKNKGKKASRNFLDAKWLGKFSRR